MSRRGFTLIELLVVVSIITFLSSIVLASIADARQKAKVAAAKQTLGQIALALELYKDDHGGFYPGSYTAWLTSSESASPSWVGGSAGVHEGPQWIREFAGQAGGQFLPPDGLVPNYISSLPQTPGGGNPAVNSGACLDGAKPTYYYKSQDVGLDGVTHQNTAYKLVLMCPGGTGFPDSGDNFYDLARPGIALSICGPMPDCKVPTSFGEDTYFCYLNGANNLTPLSAAQANCDNAAQQPPETWWCNLPEQQDDGITCNDAPLSHYLLSTGGFPSGGIATW